jgi:hypothetical protein
MAVRCDPQRLIGTQQIIKCGTPQFEVDITVLCFGFVQSLVFGLFS